MNTRMRPGFTLMEVLFVMVIGAGIVLGAYKMISGVMHKIKIKTTKNVMIGVKQALDLYQMDMKHLPAQDRREKGLTALVERPAKLNPGEEWSSRYIDAEPVDAWNKEIEYNLPPKKYRDRYKKYELISSGGSEDEADEITDGV